MDWIHKAQEKNQWLSFLKRIINNLLDSIKVRLFSVKTLRFLRRDLLRGVIQACICFYLYYGNLLWLNCKLMISKLVSMCVQAERNSVKKSELGCVISSDCASRPLARDYGMLFNSHFWKWNSCLGEGRELTQVSTCNTISWCWYILLRYGTHLFIGLQPMSLQGA
jgi:hypothetical protein